MSYTKVSSFAGKPAPLAMLVDVPRLVTAYYTARLISHRRRSESHLVRRATVVPLLKIPSTKDMFWLSVRLFAITAPSGTLAAHCFSALIRTRCLYPPAPARWNAGR